MARSPQSEPTRTGDATGPGDEQIEGTPDASLFRRRRSTVLDAPRADLPVHYFTLVLNGEPFIRHHLEVMKQLSFPWHWHIVEGAASLHHDTGWSLAGGGHLPEGSHRAGLSVDGTSAYLDEMAALHPGQVTVHRPVPGQFWDGKIAMVAEPLRHLFEDAILWEVDADELWTVEQLEEGRWMFLAHPEKAAAWFWCDYFVGQDRIISSRHGYAQNPQQEWLRAWRYRPGMKWLTHEPPVLAERQPDGTWRDVARGQTFSHSETEARGLVFQHFAYATREQVAFKELYYGYAGAQACWERLQSATKFPQLLSDFLPWVKDHTEVDVASVRGVVPLAEHDAATGEWTFQARAPLGRKEKPGAPVIVVDGVFFQLNQTGIARVWHEVLAQWVISGTAAQVWLLDRDGTAPGMAGVRRRRTPRLDVSDPGTDSRMLQQICDELQADVFISTYCTAPTTTPCVALVHDMIPELLNVAGLEERWLEKRLGILQSRRWVCVSESTALDLRRLHPWIPSAAVTVARPAAGAVFHPADDGAVAAFRARHGLEGDYVMVVGERIGLSVPTLPQGYKNAALAFEAWQWLEPEIRESVTFLCTGGQPEVEESLQNLAPGARIQCVRLDDADLATAYSGALVLVYPSVYEGFGLPVVEAMACGCPVIACRLASLPEVAGEAAIWVEPSDAQAVAAAMKRLRGDSEWRAGRVSAGHAQAARFSFATMAETLAGVLVNVATSGSGDGFEAGSGAGVWSALREVQARLVAREREVIHHRENNALLLNQLEQMRARLQEKKDEVKGATKRLKKAHQRLAKLEGRVEKRRERWWRRWFCWGC
ncbi:MAG TPA: glycosyltransferase [Verrucomicrobium sp.]|nr:glycosyltransferase [Verrucomicrobium sp.]